MKRLAPLFLFLLLAACAVQAAQRTLKVRARYLNIPVSDRTERGRLSFHALGVDDLTVLVRLAEGEPDYWVFKDLTPYRGQTLTLTYEGSDAALGRLFVADTIMGQATMYREPQRPQFHFTGSSITTASTTSSISTTPTSVTGRTCTGATLRALTSCTGRSWTTPSSPTAWG